MHKLVFDIITNKGFKTQIYVCFRVKDFILGLTPLMVSIKNNNIKKTEELLKAGADFGEQDKELNTPFHYYV